MAKFIAAENVEIFAVTTLSSLTSPTATQINAGTRLTTKMTGGVTIDFAANLVDAATLESAFNSTVAGTFGGGLNSLNGVLKDNVVANDTIWTTATRRGTTGWLVVAPYNPGTVIASGDVVDIYPWEVVSQNIGDLARDQLVKFDVGFAITSAPTLGATAVT